MGREILDLPAPPADDRIQYGPGEFHFGDLRLPAGDGPFPVVMTIHGGFWRALRTLTYMGHVCEALRSAGMATWNIEYRRIGNAGGGYPGTLDDAAGALEFIVELARSYPLDLSRTVVAGHSAGGHLALWLATTKGPAALQGAVGLGSVADLELACRLNLGDNAAGAFMGASPEESPESYAKASPIANLPCGVRQRLFHGDQDDIVPVEIARRYHERAVQSGDDCRLIELPGAGHFEVIDPRASEWALVQSAIVELTSPDL